MNRLQEIEARMAAIKGELERDGADIDALETEVRSLTEEKQKIEKRKKILDDIGGGAGTPIPFIPKEERNLEKMERQELVATPEYRSAWLKALQGNKLTEAEQRAYDSGASSAGAAIPTQTSETLFAKMVKLAPMLSEITLLRVAGNIQFATEGVRNAAYQHAENSAITAATDTLVKVSLTGYEYNKLLYVSKTVQTMAINAFEGWLVDMIAGDIAVIIEDKIINGNGSTAPKGIEYAGTWTADTNLVVCTGTFVVTYADVVKMIALLPARYDSNAKFLASKAMAFQGLANIKDTAGRPIFILDATGQHPARVLGYPVLVSDKVAAKTLYLGDYKKVVGNLSQDVTVEKDASAGFASNSIAYRGGAIFDCSIALADAFVKLTVNTY
jgi:HK97 family phage major capsid protein